MGPRSARGGHWVGGAVFGDGSWQQKALTVAGGVLGGGVGFQGGAAGQARLQVMLARQRQVAMLDANRGFNISPLSWGKYPTIGRAGSFLPDRRAVTDAIGPLPTTGNTATISASRAASLEGAMGLERGSLSGGFKVRQVEGIRDMSPRSPLEGNQYFRGPGQHLPGGGPELVVNSIPTADGPGVSTIFTVLVR